MEELIIAAFAILECEPGCAEEEVKSSYRQLVRVWHPDRFESDSKLKQKATEKMKLLNEAYQLLMKCFDAQRNQTNAAQQENKENQSAKPKRETGTQNTKTPDGVEKVKVTKETDVKAGHTYYKKVVTVCKGSGRWIHEDTKIFKTRPLTQDESFEFAASQSMSFSLPPEKGRRITHYDYGPGLGPSEHDGTGNEYLFSDGSLLYISSVSTDTWFRDDNKKATYGRTSTSLAGLQEAHQVFKKNRDWKACVEVSKRAVELHGKDSWGWIQRSYALHCLKMTREAFEALKPAASLFPGTITIFYNLACYAAKLGDTNGAKHWLKSVFDLAEKSGAYSGTFERYRKMALEDSDLVSVRNFIPQPPMAWKFRKYFGV